MHPWRVLKKVQGLEIAICSSFKKKINMLWHFDIKILTE